jgi:hypothetical protein
MACGYRQPQLTIFAQSKIVALYTLSAASFTIGVLKAVSVLGSRVPRVDICFAASVFFGIQAMQTLEKEKTEHAQAQTGLHKSASKSQQQLKVTESRESDSSADSVDSGAETDMTPIRLRHNDVLDSSACVEFYCDDF